MELFFLSGRAGPKGDVLIGGEEARHLSRVLRHRPGDRVFATDGKGNEYELELVEVRPDRAVGRVRSTRERPREPGIRLVLAQSVIKADRLAELVAGVTQLGVAGVMLMRTKRTVANLGKARLEHLRKIARAAVKCSTRTVLPEVSEPVELGSVLARAREFDAAVVADEEEDNLGLGDVLDRRAKSVLLVVGPEGGFERDEIGQLEAAGVRRFTMGPRRFRAETAALAATALVLYHAGDMGGREEKCGVQKGGVSERWQVLP